MTQTERRREEAIGICESITQRIEERLAGSMFPEEWDHLVRQLREIEDRVYGKGEYAAGNAGRTAR
jgi:hypothetical protein